MCVFKKTCDALSDLKLIVIKSELMSNVAQHLLRKKISGESSLVVMLVKGGG